MMYSVGLHVRCSLFTFSKDHINTLDLIVLGICTVQAPLLIVAGCLRAKSGPALCVEGSSLTLCHKQRRGTLES